jgi:hypothetical protein
MNIIKLIAFVIIGLVINNFFIKPPSQVIKSYIDPGSLTIFLQFLIGGIVGVYVFFKDYIGLYLKKLTKVFKKK